MSVDGIFCPAVEVTSLEFFFAIAASIIIVGDSCEFPLFLLLFDWLSFQQQMNCL